MNTLFFKVIKPTRKGRWSPFNYSNKGLKVNKELKISRSSQKNKISKEAYK